MLQLTTLLRSLRSLGARGAQANVQAVLEAWAREDWLVEGLTHRLASATLVTPASVAITRAV